METPHLPLAGIRILAIEQYGAGPYATMQKAANLPPSFVIIQRISLGLYAILGDLRATADWRAIAEELWPFVDAPPSTPMGEAIDQWRRHRHPDGARLSG